MPSRVTSTSTRRDSLNLAVRGSATPRSRADGNRYSARNTAQPRAHDYHFLLAVVIREAGEISACPLQSALKHFREDFEPISASTGARGDRYHCRREPAWIFLSDPPRSCVGRLPRGCACGGAENSRAQGRSPKHSRQYRPNASCMFRPARVEPRQSREDRHGGLAF